MLRLQQKTLYLPVWHFQWERTEKFKVFTGSQMKCKWNLLKCTWNAAERKEPSFRFRENEYDMNQRKQ